MGSVTPADTNKAQKTTNPLQLATADLNGVDHPLFIGVEVLRVPLVLFR